MSAGEANQPWESYITANWAKEIEKTLNTELMNGKHSSKQLERKGRLVLDAEKRNHVNRAKTPSMMAVRLAAGAFSRETLSQASGVNYLDPEIVEEIFGKYFVLVSPNTCMI